MSEYINGDNELPVYTDLDDDHGELTIQHNKKATAAVEDSDPEGDADVLSHVPKIKDFKEVV